MLCPRCRISLVMKEAEGHIGFMCEECRGLWLPHAYMASLRHCYRFDPQALLAELAANRITPSPNLDCPSCGKKLYTSRIKEIELEWCGRCKGVRFDQGELSKLVTFQQQLTPAQYALWAAGDGIQIVGCLLEFISGS